VFKRVLGSLEEFKVRLETFATHGKDKNTIFTVARVTAVEVTTIPI
jgi:hypothetical protein